MKRIIALVTIVVVLLSCGCSALVNNMLNTAKEEQSVSSEKETEKETQEVSNEKPSDSSNSSGSGSSSKKKSFPIVGNSIRVLSKEEMAEFNTTSSLCVFNVPSKSPAGEAGMKKGDIITHVNDEQVNTYEEYQQLMETIAGGSVIKYTMLRDGKAIELNVASLDMADY